MARRATTRAIAATIDDIEDESSELLSDDDESDQCTHSSDEDPNSCSSNEDDSASVNELDSDDSNGTSEEDDNDNESSDSEEDSTSSVDEEQDSDDSPDNSSSGDEEQDSDADASDDDSTLYCLPKYVSKDKEETWDRFPISSSSRGRRNRANIVHQRPGPTRYSRRECDTIPSSFQLFFRASLLEEISKWSNKEGQRVYKDKWVDISSLELKKFIGALILIGVYKSKNEEVGQLWSRNDGRPIFNQIMSRERFRQIVKVLRFDDATARRARGTQDKLQPIKNCFTTWNKHLQDAYIPSESMTVDEQLVTFRGRCPFRQYIKSKPGRYGIKIWAICDSDNSYVWAMEIYAGKKASGREVNQGERVVLSLTQDIQKSGRNITCDNFFTSIGLARKLLSRQLTIVGTIRRNRKELPSEFVTVKDREVYSTLFGFQDDSMIVSYCPKKGKIVTLLSTMHSEPDIDHSNEKKKPEVILAYNATKGGVDTMDQMVRCYSVKRMTRRWPMVIFYNMIDVSALNAYIIWMSLKPTHFSRKSNKRRQFLIALGKELAGVQTERPVLEPPTPAELEEPPRKKRRCFLCATKKDRKTKTVCKKCQKNVCGEHSQVLCYKCVQ